MPIAKIEVCRSHPPEMVAALIEAVYQAQIEALKGCTRASWVNWGCLAFKHRTS